MNKNFNWKKTRTDCQVSFLALISTWRDMGELKNCSSKEKCLRDDVFER